MDNSGQGLRKWYSTVQGSGRLSIIELKEKGWGRRQAVHLVKVTTVKPRGPS